MKINKIDHTKAVAAMTAATFSDPNEQKRVNCYLFRRVLDMTPIEVARELRIHPKQVNLNAISLSGLFDERNGRNSYSGLLDRCAEHVHYYALQQHTTHQKAVAERTQSKLHLFPSA